LGFVRFRVWLVVLALVPVVGASGATPHRPRTGGTVVVAGDWTQEPPHLNPFVDPHPWPRVAIPHAITMAGAFRVTPRWTYEPDLVSKASVRRRGSGMVVTYVIDKRARWNDRVPITAEDFRFTWQVNSDRRYRELSTARAGYAGIRSVTGGSSKTVAVAFARVLSGWRDLFSEVLPAHALRGVNLANAWRSAIDNPKTGKPIASGPFYLAEWRRGCCLIFKRNRRYWKRRPYLDSIVLRFEEDVAQQARDLFGGRLDLLPTEHWCDFLCRDNAPPPNLRVDLRPNWIAEALYFNVGHGKGPLNPLLRQAWVRRAIAYGLDREDLATMLVRGETHLPIPELPVLDSAIVLRNSRYYRRHWTKYRYSVAKVRAIMTEHGCSRGSDGIFVCQGQRASFVWMGNSGGMQRELNFQIVRPRLASAGIEIRPDFSTSAIVFGRRVPEGEYDLANFGTASRPDLSGWDAVYGCRGRQGYCNRGVTALLRAANREPIQAKQAALVNRALAQLARDVVVLPLYQLPTVVIRNRRVHGVAHNAQAAGVFWDVARWWRASR